MTPGLRGNSDLYHRGYKRRRYTVSGDVGHQDAKGSGANSGKVVEVARDSRHRRISNSYLQLLSRGNRAREDRALDSRGRTHFLGKGHKLLLTSHDLLCRDVAQTENQDKKRVRFKPRAPHSSACIEQVVRGESEKENEQPSEQHALIWQRRRSISRDAPQYQHRWNDDHQCGALQGGRCARKQCAHHERHPHHESEPGCIVDQRGAKICDLVVIIGRDRGKAGSRVDRRLLVRLGSGREAAVGQRRAQKERDKGGNQDLQKLAHRNSGNKSGSRNRPSQTATSLRPSYSRILM